MGEFFNAVLSFPTVLFSFLLLVVIGYWLLVLTGLIGLDGGDEVDVEAGSRSAGFLGGIGLDGPPASVSVSLLIAVAWFTSLAGMVLLDQLGFGSGTAAVLTLLLLGLALLVSWLVTRLLVVPLRRLFPAGPESSRSSFVGSLCVIRTGRVTADFGQAEVRAPDGSTAIVQVRQTGGDQLSAGSPALIYDYDHDGEFFWVMPTEATFNPEPSPYRSS